MSANILETTRLSLRKIQQTDYDSICSVLQDIDVMYAWEHAFSDQEVIDWINENILRYGRDGYNYWAAIEKSSDELIGVSGIIAEQVEDERHIGIGYIFNKAFWKQGYAYEAASACIDHAFNILRINEITAQIRPENIASIKVAEKLGMVVKRQFIRHYKGKDMLHLLYSRRK